MEQPLEINELRGKVLNFSSSVSNLKLYAQAMSRQLPKEWWNIDLSGKSYHDNRAQAKVRQFKQQFYWDLEKAGYSNPSVKWRRLLTYAEDSHMRGKSKR